MSALSMWISVDRKTTFGYTYAFTLHGGGSRRRSFLAERQSDGGARSGMWRSLVARLTGRNKYPSLSMRRPEVRILPSRPDNHALGRAFVPNRGVCRVG